MWFALVLLAACDDPDIKAAPEAAQQSRMTAPATAAPIPEVPRHLSFEVAADGPLGDRASELSRELEACQEFFSHAGELSLHTAWSVEDGAVAQITVADDAGNPGLAGCLAERVSGWSLPEAEGGDVIVPITVRRE